MLRWVLRIAILLAVLAGGAGAYGYRALAQPYKGFDMPKMLEIPRGSTSRQIARQLKEAGVIQEEWYFLAARALKRQATLQAGEYQFVEPASVFEVFRRIQVGDVYTFEFTVPEGSNIWDIARLLESNGIMREADFLAAASDPSLVADIAPEAESLEGYLFPSTYRLSHSTTASDLCKMMVDQFRREWRQLGGEPSSDDQLGKPGARLDVHALVTLASLVEEETGVPSEREEVAGVFANRLRKGMQLACDPTVMYANHLQGIMRNTIYRTDLKREHPYNTYLIFGLPPGPISSPGVASMRAAMMPAQTDAIYFVARPDGTGHVFSATLAQHNRAVNNYRQARALQTATAKNASVSAAQGN